MKNKILTVLTLAVMMALTPASGLYGQDTKGLLTPEIGWRVENGTLYLSGQGVVPTTMFMAQSDWSSYRQQFNAVVIENGITELGKNLFLGYKNVTSLTIAGSVKNLDINSFNGCKKLSLVEVKGATPPDITMATFYKVKFKKAKLIVPAGTKATYEADALWNRFATIEESAQPAETQPAPVETLTKPCFIYIKRPWNYIGGGVGVRVFLNGTEQEKLRNGETLPLQTDRNKNELYLQYGKKKPIAMRRFDATAGSEIYMEYSHFNGYVNIMSEKFEEE